MIVPMKKVYIVTQAKDSASSIEAVRSLGIVHVEHECEPRGASVSSIQEDVSLAAHALDILSRYIPAQPQGPAPEMKDWRHSARHIAETQKRIEQLQEHSRALRGKINEWAPWGDFDPEAVRALACSGVHVGLFQIPQKELGSVPAGLIVHPAAVSSGMALCAVVALSPFELPFKEIQLPALGLSAMRGHLEQNSAHERHCVEELVRHAACAQSLRAVLDGLYKDLAFQQAVAGMGQAGALVYLKGFLPVDTVDRLRSEAARRSWAVLVGEPGEEDPVPTFLRNPRWVEIIKPVFSLLGIIPGYRELDVSPVFLVFFSIFFGILIGDAGYGVVYLLLTAWFHKKQSGNRQLRTVFYLLYLLSGFAVLWGVLTATFFGSAWLAAKGVRPLVPQLTDVKGMQTFCFFLGALHLTIAHGWRTILKLPSLAALMEIGWICVLWAAFLMARTLILAEPFPSWGKWLILSGVSLVVLFTHPQRNVLKAVGAGLGNIALSLMNNFTDVVSYVRLFAVGLAGVAIADTTNGMAQGLGEGWILVAAGAVIAVIGHALNLVLGPMSVLVHGVRLNVLEFSSHAGLSWSGAPYAPLKE